MTLYILVLFAGIIVGLACLYLPSSYDGDDISRFSAQGAALCIKEISKEPHSVLDIPQN